LTPRRRPTFAWVLAVVAAYVIGYLAGHDPRGDATAGRSAHPGPSTPPASVPATVGTVHWSDVTCEASAGDRLTLGTIIVNDASTPATLTLVAVTIPDDTVLAEGWTDCGGAFAGARRLELGPGQQTWLAIRTDAPVHCPQGLRVGFIVSYTLNGDDGLLPVNGPNPYGAGCTAG
jgi:hypothetical protein